MKLKQKLLSLALSGVLLFGMSATVANAQGQWSSQNGKWYYSNNGTYSKGWSQIGGQWYYFNGNAEMQTGWLNEGGKWYYLNNSGAMHIGWLQQGQIWYYLSNDGSMVSQSVEINGKIHNFNSNGEWLGEQTNNTGTSSNSESENTTVWRANASSQYYHSSKECSNMKSPVEMTLKEALDKHLEKCPKCHKN